MIDWIKQRFMLIITAIGVAAIIIMRVIWKREGAQNERDRTNRTALETVTKASTARANVDDSDDAVRSDPNNRRNAGGM